MSRAVSIRWKEHLSGVSPYLVFLPRPRVDIAEVPAVSHAGAVLLTDTLHATGLAASLREALIP